MKKTSLILFTLLVIAAVTGAFLGYQKLKSIKQPEVKITELLPSDCEMLFIASNFSEINNALSHQNLLWQDLSNTNQYNQTNQLLALFDSLYSGEPQLADYFSETPVYCAFYKNGFIIALSLKEVSTETKMQEIFTKLNTTLSRNNLQVEIKMGIVSISNSTALLSLFYTKEKKSLSENDLFAELNNSVKYDGLSLYLSKSSKLPIAGSYSGITFKPDRIVLNGVKKTDSILPGNYLGLKPFQSLEFIKHVPLICNAFELFVLNTNEYLASDNKALWWKSVNDSAMYNAQKQFYQALDGMASQILMPSGELALVLGIENKENINELMPYMTDSLFANQVGRLLQNKYDFSESTFPDLKTRKLKFVQLFDDYLVLTESENDAAVFFNAHLNGSSILNNERFRMYAKKNFDADFHYLNYCLINATSRKHIPFGNYFSDEEMNHFKNVGHFSLAANHKNGISNFRVSINYLQENVSDEPNSLWTLKTDSVINYNSYLFKNHKTKENEILFQAGKNLHLVSATGKVLWKKELQESIESEILTVDAFNNGKYQMLFNTANYLHLIDRNGNYVAPFPVKLPAAATNKLQIFDYENNNDLRLFIACEDRKIYNYTIKGNKNEGFKPLLTMANVSLPIRYGRVGLSDYLITADVKGNFYAFSRKGDGRIDFKNKMVEDATTFELIVSNSLANTKIVYYDKKGNLIHRVSLTDVKEISKINKSESDQHYEFYDINQNKLSDLIVNNGSTIEIYEVNGEPLPFLKLTQEAEISGVKAYESSIQNFISAYSSSTKISFVCQFESGQVKQFPSTGLIRVCNLFNDGKAYALVIYENQLQCIKL
ncbi:MAG: hypothetical protein IPM51_00505 [Sphingobacteriaceae bacterium]|nr:hypothetical protein [Sphingobacteriaceae bacterium]